MSYETIDGGVVPIKAWTIGVPIEEGAKEQLRQTASLPIVWPHLAVMPDVHWGIGATVGSVVPTRGAIVPASVGVDIGCGMIALQTSLTSSFLGDNGEHLFEVISKAVPHGRSDNGGANDRGAWGAPAPHVVHAWERLESRFLALEVDFRRGTDRRPLKQLGTLGGGNHFIELCLDEADHVWIMLHSGSRGTGNTIGTQYISTAKKRCERDGIALPNRDLAWLPEGTPEFDNYIEAVAWAQDYAKANRDVMMQTILMALSSLVEFTTNAEAVNCHHNYISRETHFGEELIVTRKGAVSARLGELGIIPGSMGRSSFIVRGKGNAESFHSCSHGAGRVMSRTVAKKEITLEQHIADTKGVFCRKDAEVLDESPRAYKDLSAVMSAQSELVEVVHELHAVVCVKG
jgi:tRNA-splicing ligase RtcB